MHLLLVEDDLMLGEALQEALSPRSYVVDWVKDGASALRALATQEFDLMQLLTYFYIVNCHKYKYTKRF